MLFTLAQDATGPGIALHLAQAAHHHGIKRLMDIRARVGRHQRVFGEIRQHLFQGAVFTTPPGRHGGQLKLFTQHMARQRRQKSQQRGRLQKGRTGCIRHQHIARANRLQQARHTQRGIGAQLQRVHVLVVHALEQPVNRHQALQGLEEQVLVTDDQVAAFHQGQAQVARQVGMFKISLVVGAGRHQRDVRFGTRWAERAQALHQCPVGGCQTLHPHVLKGLGKLPRHSEPILQQIAQTRGRLRALAYQPPQTVRPAREVKRCHMQVHATGWHHAMHIAQVTRMAVHQRTWQQALFEKVLRSVDVGQHGFEQAYPLQHTLLDIGPTRGVNDQRKQVQRPGALRAFFIGIDVVGDAVVANLALQTGVVQVHVGGGLRVGLGKKFPPRTGQSGLGHVATVHAGHTTTQLVKMPRLRGTGLRLGGHVRCRKCCGTRSGVGGCVQGSEYASGTHCKSLVQGQGVKGQIRALEP